MKDLRTEVPDLPNAACRGLPVEWWFPDDGHEITRMSHLVETRLAMMTCRDCPVRPSCLAGALSRNEVYGIWGGYTPRQRRAMQRGKRVPTTPKVRHRRVVAATPR